jgi:hypothetical protein
MQTSTSMKLKKNRHQHLAKVNAELIRPILQKNGFEDVNILLHWPQIVGEYLAQFASPQKITHTAGTQYGCLVIEVYNPGFALEIQAMESTIVERIATYLGGKTIFRVKTVVARKQQLAKPQPTAIYLKANTQQINADTADSIEKTFNQQDQELLGVLESIYKHKFVVKG